MQSTEQQFMPLAEARPRISDADLLLFRRCSPISIAGRGTHSHAAKAAWWEGDLFCVEVREWHGGRAVTLESQVHKFPNRIDLYHANPQNRWPEFDRTRSTTMMRRAWPAATTGTQPCSLPQCSICHSSDW